MTRKITPAQRRALLWLAKASGDTQKASHWMIGANVSAQVAHNLQRDGFIRVVSRSWNNSIETVRITAAGRDVLMSARERAKREEAVGILAPRYTCGVRTVRRGHLVTSTNRS